MNAIEVRNLSKKFTHYPSQRDRLFDMATGGRAKRGTDFWALRDISFDVPQGTTFGIIGQNGSGKSTLLSILAGVLQPTSGTFVVNGKVAAILELGSGFHHEFTGRENVYMYGTILGFSRVEINRRLDEIIDFSELHEFIDKPLYTYSSGMVIRLAFATAVNVDADILIIDEALAVGDMRFHLKCFRMLSKFIEAGRTVVLVSHDIGAISNFCETTLWIHNGQLQEISESSHVAEEYTSFIMRFNFSASVNSKQIETLVNQTNNADYDKNIQWEEIARCDEFGEGGARITHAALQKSDTNEKGNILKGGERVFLFVKMLILRDIENPIVGFIVKNRIGQQVLGANSSIFKKTSTLGEFKKNQIKVIKYEFEFPRLMHGEYAFSLAIAEGTQQNHTQHHWVHDAYIVSVHPHDENGFLGWMYCLDTVSIVGLS